MAGIVDLLQSDLGKQIIGGVSKQTNEPENKTAEVLGMALPMLTGAMKKNASSEEGASGLLNVLTGKHNGGIMDNLSGFFGGGVDDKDMNDGGGILGHLLGKKQPVVESSLSKQTGVQQSSVSNILKIAAPIVMGYVGKKALENKVNSQGLGGLLSGLLGGQSNKEQSMLESFLDADGDGSVMDDLAGMFMGGNKKKGEESGGGLLGGLFGG